MNSPATLLPAAIALAAPLALLPTKLANTHPLRIARLAATHEHLAHLANNRWLDLIAIKDTGDGNWTSA